MSQNKKYKFMELWNEDTEISWWKECRTALNLIIQEYNDWQIDGFDHDRAVKVNAKIEHGIQTIGNKDGGACYMEDLIEMQSFVKTFLQSVEG